MKLFNTRTIVGLFDRPKNMEHALTKLHQQGFGQDDESLQIIDEQHLSQNPSSTNVAPGIPPGQAHTAGVPVSISDMIAGGSDATEQDAYDILTSHGLDDAEATFYAKQVARGNQVVLLQTDEAHVTQARDTLEQFDAKTVIA